MSVFGDFERYRRLGSFLFLLIAPIVADRFCEIDAMSFVLLGSPMVFPISLLLSHFLRKQDIRMRDMSFDTKVVISASTTFITIMLSIVILFPGRSLAIWQGVVNIFAIHAIGGAFIYSILFGLFFSSQSHVSIDSIVLQSFTITLLMLMYYYILSILNDMLTHSW